MKKPKYTVAQQKERYKQCVLIELSNYLYSVVMEKKEDFNSNKLAEIRAFIDNHYKEYRKELIALKKDAQALIGLDYSKASIHRMIQILIYMKLPKDSILKKFKDANAKNIKEVYSFLVEYKKNDLQIDELTIYKDSEDYYDDSYISLMNTLVCMGYDYDRAKDMSFIKNNEFYDLCNYCGLIEAYKARPMLTIRKINKILTDSSYEGIYRGNKYRERVS